MIGVLWRATLLSVVSALALAQDEDSVTADMQPPSDAEPLPWSVQLAAEAGIGMRDIRLPRDNVSYQIGTGVYPVLGLAFALEHRSSERVSVGLVARYQSSFGLVLDEQLTGGASHARKTRSHQFEVGIAPRVHWDESGWAISGMVGYGVSELDPENHLVTPSYHLGGPQARVSVRVPLGTPRIGLSLGGDGQITLQVGDELQARGVSAHGFGAGAHAALDLRLSERWWIAASYRELHFWLATQQQASFTDAARIISAQLRGTL